MTYADIDQANSGIKMLNLKGKDYAMVPERVTAFRKVFPDGFISTEILSHDGQIVTMKAKAGYYLEGREIILGTGFAQEEKGKGLVNGTSYIENCETSAVGRALGFLGFGLNGGGICSAEELVNAITAQRQNESEKAAGNAPRNAGNNQTGKQSTPPAKTPDKAQNGAGNVTVETSGTVPPVNPPQEEESPVKLFLLQEMRNLREARGISADKNNKLFAEQRKTLIAAGLAPDKKIEEYTMEEAKELIRMMYECFPPEGTELKK